MKPTRISRRLFRISCALIRTFYGKKEIVGMEKLPQKHAIIVANHCQLNGPLYGELFLPERCDIWCAGQMIRLRDVPQYAFTDFWSQKPKWQQPFFRVCSYLIAPICSFLCSHARVIPVYRDTRILSTFRETVKRLEAEKLVLIFPEKDEKFNNILYRFQENFVDIARPYYKKTGVELSFIPMYIAPRMKKAFVGDAIQWHADAPAEEERTRISSACADAITNLARSLPRHTVVPYRNVPRRNYLTNQDITEVPK